MFNELIAFMHSHSVLVFFLVLSLGYLLGKISIMGISMGPAGGVLLAGLFFGNAGFTMYPALQTMGFAIFIFCVGYQAGPKFFDVLMTSGLKYLSLSLLIAATGFGLAVSLASYLDLAPGLSAGLLGGALTTTPTLAAAQDAVTSGLATIPEGYTPEQIKANIGAGYALTYLFGLIGLILCIRLLPKILGINLPEEAAKLIEKEGGSASTGLSHITHRTYRITKTGRLNRTVSEIEMAAFGKVSIAGMRHQGRIVEVSHDTKPEIGDDVLIIGEIEHLLANAATIGEEISDEDAMNVKMSVVKLVISKSSVAGTPVSELQLNERIGMLPLEVHRQRMTLPMTPDLVLRIGDVITCYGPDVAIDRMARQLGHVEQEVDETDLFTFGLGIVLGIFLGALSITVGGLTLELGMAGGLLITGLLIGFTRSIWPIFGRVPSASRWVLMELGLMMFMAGVGLNAGGGIIEIIKSSGLQLILAGIAVTLIPVLTGYAFSRKVLKLNPAEALGGVTGSMTSGAALSVVCDAAKSNVPALGYTGAYAFANVILTLAGTLIMLI